MKRDSEVIVRLYQDHIGGLGLAFFIAVTERNHITASDVTLIAF